MCVVIRAFHLECVCELYWPADESLERVCDEKQGTRWTYGKYKLFIYLYNLIKWHLFSVSWLVCVTMCGNVCLRACVCLVFNDK